MQKQGITPQQPVEPKYYHPNTLSKGSALFITIAVMIGSLMFKQWYVAWFGHTDRP